ncbi:glycosyltransferase family protein [Methanoplanus limicola]|uniref:Glycosyl transferase group 1 n=1 Tax=Methanoplanus limicola DSM 2279 TaxID=937775 RepID=H1Z0C6_9EURY|nr:glycosyltransferase [Methanoplanus limicola]EHQ34393.1 hypothetical protein Metlim_0246 [Methanoplanus limicola DSM 2279]
MQVILLDHHYLSDGRIERHLKYILSKNINTTRLHFNRCEPNLKSGLYSQFGEKSYRINVNCNSNFLKRYSSYLVFYYSSYLIYKDVKKAIKTLKINKYEPTIIHVHDPALLNLAKILKKNIFNKSIIIYDRHEVYEKKINIKGIKITKLSRIYEIRAKKHINGIISVSEKHNQKIKDMFPMAQISTIPNYPSTSDYNIKYIYNKIDETNSKNDINLVYVGSLANNYNRDIDLLLAVYKEVLLKFPNVNCYVGGTCNDPKINKKMADLKQEFGNKFNYLGRISRSKTAEITENSHIGFLLMKPDTHWVRTSPNKTYEYLMCGALPVIRADVDHSNEFAKCSLMFNRNTSEEEIIQGVIDLLEEPDKLKNMMEGALHLSKKFSFELVNEKYYNIYESLLHTEGYYNK